MYKVLNEFIDKTHDKTHYKIGDNYPKKGFNADDKRVKFLQSDKNKYTKVFLGEKIVDVDSIAKELIKTTRRKRTDTKKAESATKKPAPKKEVKK